MKHNPDTEKRKLTSDDQKLDDETVRKLMKLAGRRRPISTDVHARVHEKVEHEWRQATTLSRATRWAVPLALAASLVIAITILVSSRETGQEPLGAIARISSETTNHTSEIVLSQTVYAGDTIRTSHGQRASIAMAEARSLRFAEDTVLRLDSADKFTLLRGQVYSDSGHAGQYNDGLTIYTKLGSVTDVGTQFSVRYEDGHFGVAVREGRVDFVGDQTSYTALAGDQLILQENGTVSKSQIAANDDSWSWAMELAPDFEIENRSLLDFLNWAARETGREVIFVDDEMQKTAMATILHGSVSGFTPFEAIASVFATTSLDYQLDEQRLIIGK